MSTDGARVLALKDIDRDDLLGFIEEHSAKGIEVHQACDLYGGKIGYPGFEVERIYYLIMAEKGLEEELSRMERPAVAGGSSWVEGDSRLRERIIENNRLPREERKMISTILREVAEETGKSFRSVQLRYYSVIKKQLEREVTGECEERTEEVPNQKAEGALDSSPPDTPSSLPRVGELVNARVTNIIDYGVFAMAEEGYQGFIRLGEVTRDEWLYGRADLERYFHPGENIKVKVVSTTDGKVYFSCKAVGGKKPHGFNSANGNSLKVSRGSSIEKELSELVTLLSSRVGGVSDSAREGLGELMITHGVVKVTARMFEVIDHIDQSAWVVRELKESLDNEFNRVFR